MVTWWNIAIFVIQGQITGNTDRILLKLIFGRDFLAIYNISKFDHDCLWYVTAKVAIVLSLTDGRQTTDDAGSWSSELKSNYILERESNSNTWKMLLWRMLLLKKQKLDNEPFHPIKMIYCKQNDIWLWYHLFL